MSRARRALCAVFGHAHHAGEVTCQRCGGVDPERARKLKEASAAAPAVGESRSPGIREHAPRRAARGARAERAPRAEAEPVREPPPG